MIINDLKELQRTERRNCNISLNTESALITQTSQSALIFAASTSTVSAVNRSDEIN